MVFLWSFKTKALLKSFTCKEASGVCYDKKEKQFLITNGLGEIYRLKNQSWDFLAKYNLQWDNHAEVFS